MAKQNQDIAKTILGLMGLGSSASQLDKDKIAQELIDPVKGYLMLTKNRLPIELQRQLDKGDLILQEGNIWHTKQMTTASGIVSLIDSDHKTGPLWSSLNKGQTEPDSIFLMEAFKLDIAVADTIQNAQPKSLYAVPEFWLADLEIKVGDKIILEQNMSDVKNEYYKSGIPVWSDYAFSFQYPVVILPNSTIRVNIKMPDGVTYSAPDGQYLFINFTALGLKTYKK